MRNFLLASVATLGTAGLMSAAYAQTTTVVTTAPAPVAAPTQGQSAWKPAASPPAGANNNNNKQAAALPGQLANPTPGTIVVHFNGLVMAEGAARWTSVDKRIAAAPAAGSQAAVLGLNGAGPVKLAPQSIETYARLFAGMDGMATNGLRYGAAIEVRQNFSGQISNNSSSGASGYSSMETMFVRRAFTYIAGDQWGIVRVGQADGLISLFDSGTTTFQFLPSGNLNGGDLQNMPGATPPFVYLGGAGNEYDNAKIVYLSPQIAGFDFGIHYAPNTSNGSGISAANVNANNALSGSGIGTGNTCAVANTGCPTLSTGPGVQDGSRSINQTAIGVRYQGVLGGVGLLAYGVYEFSGHAQYSGTLAAATAGNPAGSGSRFTGQYNGLSIGSGGVALTYAGFTVGGNVVGGNMNGQLGLQPKGGAPLFGVLAGVKYTAGPFTVGIVGEEFWMQGNVNLSGVTQRRGRGISAGASYAVAPGFTVFGEYLWNDQKQNLNNFNPAPGVSGTGSNANNTYTGQGVMIGNLITF